MGLNDSTPLASPTFVTGPTDTVAAADPYKAKGGVINSIQDQLKSAGISIPDVLKGGKALATLLPIVQGIKNGSLLVDRNALIQRLLASSTSITSAFKLMGTDAQNSLLGGIKDVGKYAVTINDITRQVQTTDFKNLNAVGQLVNSFTGQTSTLLAVDKDSLAGIVSGTVKECTKFGIPNSFGALTSTINDSTIIKGAIGQSIGTVISSSDVASLKSMCNAVNDGSIPLISPNVIGSFGQQFQRTTAVLLDATPKNDASTLNSVLDTYNSVNSDWNVCSRPASASETPGASTGTYSIASLTSASSDFKEVISNGIKTSTDTNAHLTALATVYGSTDVHTELSQSFSSTVLTTTTSSSAQSTAVPTSEGLLDNIKSLIPGYGSMSTIATAPASAINLPSDATKLSTALNAVPAATAATGASAKLVNGKFPGMSQAETDQWFADHPQVVEQFNLDGKNTRDNQGYYSKGINF